MSEQGSLSPQELSKLDQRPCSDRWLRQRGGCVHSRRSTYCLDG